MTADEYLKARDAMSDDDRLRAFTNMSPADRHAVRRHDVESFFTPENAIPEESKEYASPSGRYTLRVTPYKTRPKAWSYTLGQVYSGGGLIAEVKRNYHAFPFAFVEGHPVTGHDYLVCGEDYQGQTVVELNTGARSDRAEGGYGFCWAAIHPSPYATLLAVDGCYWGAPFRVLVADFSDPLRSPLPEVFFPDGEFTSFNSWDETGELTVKMDVEYHVSGKRRYDMNEQEREKADDLEEKGERVWETRTVLSSWKPKFPG